MLGAILWPRLLRKPVTSGPAHFRRVARCADGADPLFRVPIRRRILRILIMNTSWFIDQSQGPPIRRNPEDIKAKKAAPRQKRKKQRRRLCDE
jgi:hypothetical protein